MRSINVLAMKPKYRYYLVGDMLFRVGYLNWADYRVKGSWESCGKWKRCDTNISRKISEEEAFEILL